MASTHLAKANIMPWSPQMRESTQVQCPQLPRNSSLRFSAVYSAFWLDVAQRAPGDNARWQG